MLFHLLVICAGLFKIQGSMIDGCSPPDPDCHPSCVVYDAYHCRLCRCPMDMSPDGHTDSITDAGVGNALSTDAAWDRGFNGDWSAKVSDNSARENTGSASRDAWNSGGSASRDAWNSGGSASRDAWNSGGSDSNAWKEDGNRNSGSYHRDGQEKIEVRYVYVEKKPEVEYQPMTMRVSSPFMRGGTGASSPFSSISRDNMGPPSPALLPGQTNDYVINTHPDVIHVPLRSPGQPRYCVRCHILSCPSTCERVDEYGCHSCPCAPSRFQTMPVMRDCSSGVQHVENTHECLVTKLCIATCEHGYKLGITASDGCRECTCINQAQPIREPERKSCPATVSCMLKCKDGYLLGDTQANGCPACKCLAKGYSAGANGSGSGREIGENKTGSGRESGGGATGSNNQSKWGNGSSNQSKWGSGSNSQSKWGSSSNLMTGTSGSSNNMLSSTNGLGKGDCKPPMCLDGNMSVDQAMKIGTDSAKGRYSSGVSSGSSTMTSSMTSGSTTMASGNKDCFPMCAGGSNGQFMGGSSSSAGSGSSGCSGPFCATMSGTGSGNGGMGSGNGGMGGMGSGNNGMGGMGSGNGGMGGMGSGNGGMGGANGVKNGMGNGSSGMPFSPFSAAISSGQPGGLTQGPKLPPMNDCVGSSCSVESRTAQRDCSNLIHCLVTCDGKPLLGNLDQNGCQTCTCS